MIFRQTTDKKIYASEVVSVLIISLIGLTLTEGLLFIGTDLLNLDFRLSKIAASIIVLFWNYFARKLFVYNKE